MKKWGGRGQKEEQKWTKQPLVLPHTISVAQLGSRDRGVVGGALGTFSMCCANRSSIPVSRRCGCELERYNPSLLPSFT
jgi:hypothetical protein